MADQVSKIKYTNTRKISISFYPWFDMGALLSEIHIYEEIGGNLAHGTCNLEIAGGQEMLESITERYKGEITIEKEGGFILTIPVFIISKDWFKNNLRLTFICTKDEKFFRDLRSIDYPSIDDAISGCYKGDLDIRCKSDIKPGKETKYIQSMETGHKFLLPLLKSYRRNSIFGFTWEGKLLIKEVPGIDSQGNKEPFLEFVNDLGISQKDMYNITYDPKNYGVPENPWEPEKDPKKWAEKQSKIFRVTSFRGEFSIIHKDHQPGISNIRENDKFYNPRLFTSFRTVSPTLFPVKLGDVVKFKAPEQKGKRPFENFLVASNEFYMSRDGTQHYDENGLSFSVTTKFIGIQENGSTLPQEDPTKKDKEKGTK